MLTGTVCIGGSYLPMLLNRLMNVGTMAGYAEFTRLPSP